MERQSIVQRKLFLQFLCPIVYHEFTKPLVTEILLIIPSDGCLSNLLSNFNQI